MATKKKTKPKADKPMVIKKEIVAEVKPAKIVDPNAHPETQAK